MSYIPLDVVLMILEYVPVNLLLSARLVSKQWKECIDTNDSRLWKRQCLATHGQNGWKEIYKEMHLISIVLPTLVSDLFSSKERACSVMSPRKLKLSNYWAVIPGGIKNYNNQYNVRSDSQIQNGVLFYIKRDCSRLFILPRFNDSPSTLFSKLYPAFESNYIVPSPPRRSYLSQVRNTGLDQEEEDIAIFETRHGSVFAHWVERLPVSECICISGDWMFVAQNSATQGSSVVNVYKIYNQTLSLVHVLSGMRPCIRMQANQDVLVFIGLPKMDGLQIYIYSIQTFSLLSTFCTHVLIADIVTLHITPRNHILIHGSFNDSSTLYVYSLSEKHLECYPVPLAQLHFSPNGRFASFHTLGRIHILDLETRARHVFSTPDFRKSFLSASAFYFPWLDRKGGLGVDCWIVEGVSR